MINGGFQNHLHLIYGLPNGFIQTKVQTDTSDVLQKRKYRRKTEEELLEEYIAAQILLGRREEVLEAKKEIEITLAPLKLKLDEKKKRVRLLLIVMMMDQQ